MHELSIAEAILDAVRAEAEKRPGAHVVKVAVRVGVLAGVEPEALSFGFECLVQGTDLAPLELAIERTPRRQRCPACDLTFDVVDATMNVWGAGAAPSGLDLGVATVDCGPSLACPRCGRAETLLAGGEELQVAYLEIEGEDD